MMKRPSPTVGLERGRHRPVGLGLGLGGGRTDDEELNRTRSTTSTPARSRRSRRAEKPALDEHDPCGHRRDHRHGRDQSGDPQPGDRANRTRPRRGAGAAGRPPRGGRQSGAMRAKGNAGDRRSRPAGPDRHRSRGWAAASEPVRSCREQEMDPPGQQDGQREIDQQQVAVEQPLAVDAGHQVEEVAEGGLAAQRGQQADGSTRYQTHHCRASGRRPVARRAGSRRR